MRKLLCTLVIAIAMTDITLAAPANPTPEQHTEFNRLISQRDELHNQLETLDREAAQHIKRGDNPLQMHSRQVTVQDQLDLVELRVDILSSRYGLPVPPLPGERAQEGESDRNGRAQSSEEVFTRGRERALVHLRNDLRWMMARIDFETFLRYSGR